LIEDRRLTRVVWIETLIRIQYLPAAEVAARTSRWIETELQSVEKNDRRSLEDSRQVGMQGLQVGLGWAK
jgi:hypothetical protein